MLWRDVCDRNEALMMWILSCKYACMDVWITACVATEIRQGDGANFLPGKERYKCRHFYFYLTKIDQFLTTTYIILVCIHSVYLYIPTTIASLPASLCSVSRSNQWIETCQKQTFFSSKFLLLINLLTCNLLTWRHPKVGFSCYLFKKNNFNTS